MIYYVRHGQTDYNVFNIEQGQLDISLNANGKKQAKAVAEQLKEKPLDYIFSSPLMRSADTAKAINKYHNLQINYDDRLKEFNMGILQGTNASITLKDEYWKNPEKYCGETLEQLTERIQSFLSSISHLKGKNILIVSHGGLYNVLKAYLICKPKSPSEYFRYGLKNCEVAEIKF